MAGLSTSCYRRHLRVHGAGLVVTEMISAYGLIHGNTRTSHFLQFDEDERPIAVQLFGDSPYAMARAARIVLSQAVPPDMIDINMGCPARKVVKTGSGGALLGDETRAAEMAAAVVREAAGRGMPVTVKLRSGLREGDRTVLDLAARLEAAGVAALVLHPRAVEQQYRGISDHSLTEAVVARVSIPVIASGDIDSVADARRVYEETGACAIMVGRGVAGNPWLIGSLLRGESLERPDRKAVIDDLRVLLVAASRSMGTERAARWIRQLLGSYLRPMGVPHSTVAQLHTIGDSAILDDALSRLSDDEERFQTQAC